MTELLIDATLIILLLYAIRMAKDFQKHYVEVKQLKNELKGLMRHVQSSMKAATSTVESLQESIQFAAKHVTPHLPKATTLKDDLQFLLERGETVADRLEKLGTELKQKHLTPHSIVFDPRDDKEHKEKEIALNARTTPISLKASLEKDVSTESLSQVEHKGFFTTIRRVR
jgi:uncharacterized protein YoxC